MRNGRRKPFDGAHRKPLPLPKHFEMLEQRVLLSAAFDITNLTAARNDPTFSGINGKGVTIAVLDTGVDAKNPDLQGNVVGWYNAVTDPFTTPVDPNFINDAFDDEGHGSHVSGIAASTNPDIGVAPGAHLVDIHVFATPTEQQLAGDPVLRGLQWVALHATDYNIRVVNMSLGQILTNLDTVDTQTLAEQTTQEIQVLEGLGITVCSSSGNSYANDPVPGASDPAIVSTFSVANTWADSGQAADFGVPFGGSAFDTWFAIDNSATPDTLASTSQRSTLGNQVAAPGQDIFSTWNGAPDANGVPLLHNTISGTSMASPFVAGTVALMQDAALTFGGKYLQPSAIQRIVRQTADVIVDSNNPNNSRLDVNTNLTANLPETGLSYLRVNVERALKEVKAEMTGSSSGGPQPGPDTDNKTSTSIPVPALDGSHVFTFSGNLGTDGEVLIGPNDIDLYKVVTQAPAQFEALAALPTGGAAAQPSLRLFDVNGNELQRVDFNASPFAGNNGYPDLLTTGLLNPLTPGTYYVGISSVGNDSYNINNGTGIGGGTTTGDYTLTFTLKNSDIDGSPLTAQPLALTAPNETFKDPFTNTTVPDVLAQDSIGGENGNTLTGVADDEDYFSMVAPDNGRLDIWTDTSSFNTLLNFVAGADTLIKVFQQNSDGSITQLGGDDDRFGTDSGFQIFNAVAGTTYFVDVSESPNTQFNGPNIPTLGYDLHVAFDNGDVNGTATSATPEVIGTPVNDAIGSDFGVALMGANGGNKDVDFYEYTATQPGLLDVTAVSQTNGFTPEMSLWQFAEGSTTIQKIADTGATNSSAHLIEQMNAGDAIFVAVTGKGNENFDWFAPASGSGGQTGNYQLTSSLLPLSAFLGLSDGSIDLGTPQNIGVGQTVRNDLGVDGPLIIGTADVDLFKVVATSDQILNVRTFTNQEGDADTVLRAFDSTGRQLAFNDNLSASTTASQVRFHVTSGQSYFVGVSGAGTNPGGYNPLTGAGATGGQMGTYSMAITASPNSFAVTDAPIVAEPFGGQAVNATFTVTLDAPLQTTATVHYTTVDGTAVAGTDYTATSGTLVFQPGQTRQTISIPVLAGALSTGNKIFTLQLSNASGAPIALSSAIGSIIDINYSTVDFGGGKTATYTNQAGGKVRVSLKGPGTGHAVFANGGLNPLQLVVDGASNSVLTVRGAGSAIQDMVVNGTLKQLNAKGITLTGDLTVSGAVNKILLGGVGVAGAQSVFALGGGAATLLLGTVNDVTLTDAGDIKLLEVSAWINGNNTSDIVSARTVKKIVSKGEFDAGISGAVVGSASIKGAVSGADWSATSIKSLSVKGAITNSKIDASGDIGTVTAASMSGSDLFAGVVFGIVTLPTSSADLVTTDTIKNVTIKAGFSDSNIAASNIRKVSLKGVNTSNGGTPFGVAAQSLGSITAPPLKWNSHLSPSLLTPIGDFEVSLI